jgi:hypothetical protein
VRRVNAATRSDPVAGLDIFADDVNCYAGNVEYYKWKLVGEGKILAPVLSPEPLKQKQVSASRYEVEIPYFKGAYETPGAKGAPWLIVENLSMIPRPVWIIEGESEDPYYNFGKVMVVGVNDKTNRAALGGRYSAQFIETAYPRDYFTLKNLTSISD